jgi:uncharacterized protein YecE (DUF72 family)
MNLVDAFEPTKKMEFGKLANVEHIDFSLRPTHPRTAQVLAHIQTKRDSEKPANGPAPPPTIYIGPTGYNMKDWVGKWYPASTKERDYLKAYGKQFNTIEHNTTHYRIPDAATVRRWCDDTPDDFRFCPKVPQTISHARDLGLSSTELRVFWEQMRGFGTKMGYCFLQLPPYFEPKYLAVLQRFLEKWPPYLPLAVEVRHEAFFVDQGGDAFFALLEDMGMASVITDVSGRRDVCHTRLTNDCAMLRFVGNGLHPTDFTRVDAWIARLAEWVEQGLSTIYFFTHEPDNLLSPELAEYVAKVFLEHIPQGQLRGPVLVPPPAVQGSLF